MKFKYVLIVKFFAGSDDKDDIDSGIFLFSSNKEYSFEKMKEIFKKVNRLLNTYDFEEREEDFPISYEIGLNLDTLIDGLKIYTKATIESIESYNDMVNGIYVIEQWQ